MSENNGAAATMESPAGEEKPAGVVEEEVAREITRRVTVGGVSYTIGRFRGLKATRVLRAAGEIGRAFPEISRRAADFEQEYVEGKSIRLSRTEAEVRLGDDAREISEAAWQGSDNVLPMRRLPSTEERVAAVFPELLDAAEDQVLNLLAVLSMSNEELATADNADELEEEVKKRAKLLLHNGDLVELVALAQAGLEVGKAQLAPLGGMAGKAIGAIFPRRARMDEEEDLEIPTDPEEETETSGSGSSSSETSRPSSTDSESPTDGPEPTSSAPLTSSSDASPVA